MTIHLVEGVDRAGKTTRCRELMKETRDRLRVMVHFVAPPKDQAKQVRDEMEAILRLQHQHPELDFVLDRGWISWFVYQIMYRDATQATFKEQRRWEMQMRFLYPRAEVRLTLVEASTEELLARDDGLSTWSHADRAQMLDRLRTEQDLFKAYADNSRLGAKVVAA